jgi:hypothetical protein
MGHHPLGALAEEFPGAFPTTTAPDKMSTCFNNQWSTGLRWMVAKSCTTLVETLEIMGCLPSINHQLVQDFAGPSIVLIDSAGFHRIGIEKVVPVPLSPQSL